MLERLHASAQTEGSGSADPSAGSTGPGPHGPSTPAQADVGADKDAHAQLPNGGPGVSITHGGVHHQIRQVWLEWLLGSSTAPVWIDSRDGMIAHCG